jgi:hypothetical protein
MAARAFAGRSRAAERAGKTPAGEEGENRNEAHVGCILSGATHDEKLRNIDFLLVDL